ncbi:hypothetical protein A4H97_30115 [Niastella yeongjuensis]|uniref:Major facilitator superfamily (MFS) profile domain-containing protein n=1 Tax=Niastella yeongjuensis TaxID=354355 RepID=A0A1V9EPM0_9BACT|nr:MFS transporter [Niastella yeongjuensis]OQP48089.1 hypothetical protein A4H97_30115 [Niastella yeongjuensis]SEO26296.1 Predicted arabinose efflux permease, MFS family [Niastella yeongjuensis]
MAETDKKGTTTPGTVTNASTVIATGSFWSPFQYRVFTAIWLAALFSDLGLWMQNTGASWLIAKAHNSTIFVTLMVTATSLPIFLLGVPAGALSDIFNKRKILLITQSWMFIIAAILSVCTFLGYTSPYLILTLSFLLALGPAINETAWQSIVPLVVPPGSLASAIALNGVSINLARAIGPALAGLILSYYAASYIFILNAFFFLITFFVVFFWSGTPVSTALQTERFFAAMRIGVNYMRYANKLHPVLIRSVIFAIGVSGMFALLPIIVSTKLKLEANSYGAMLFCIGGGAIVGALVLSKINRILGADQKLLLATVVVILVLLSMYHISNVYILYVGFFISGIAWLMTMSTFNFLIQSNVPKWVLSRSISIYLLLFQGGLASGGFLWGWIADNYSLKMSLYCAAGLLSLSLLMAFRYRLDSIVPEDLTIPEAPLAVIPLLEITAVDGPVLVWVEYTVAQQDIRSFTTAAETLSQLRMRNGASQVGLFQNVMVPTLITEFYFVESWSEYQMQVERYTVNDLEILSGILKYHSGSTPPVEKVMLAQVPKEIPST